MSKTEENAMDVLVAALQTARSSFEGLLRTALTPPGVPAKLAELVAYVPRLREHLDGMLLVLDEAERCARGSDKEVS